MDGADDRIQFDIDINAIPEVPGDAPECRICGGGAEPDAPLFYPCKCSGTIRYIHQACLTTWLKHSKKQSCDVCKHPYTFKKVYKDDMPQHIPIRVVIRRVVSQVTSYIIFGIRCNFVAIVWLCLLPWLTVWVWRFCFWSGDQIAWNIYGPLEANETTLGRPNSTETFQDVWKSITEPRTVFNFSLWDSTFHVSSHPEDLEARTRHKLIQQEFSEKLASDIVMGQMVTGLLVVIFLAVFLLREWVIQNVAPGLLGDDELLGDAPVEGVDGQAGDGAANGNVAPLAIDLAEEDAPAPEEDDLQQEMFGLGPDAGPPALVDVSEDEDSSLYSAQSLTPAELANHPMYKTRWPDADTIQSYRPFVEDERPFPAGPFQAGPSDLTSRRSDSVEASYGSPGPSRTNTVVPKRREDTLFPLPVRPSNKYDQAPHPNGKLFRFQDSPGASSSAQRVPLDRESFDEMMRVALDDDIPAKSGRRLYTRPTSVDADGGVEALRKELDDLEEAARDAIADWDNQYFKMMPDSPRKASSSLGEDSSPPRLKRKINFTKSPTVVESDPPDMLGEERITPQMNGTAKGKGKGKAIETNGIVPKDFPFTFTFGSTTSSQPSTPTTASKALSSPKPWSNGLAGPDVPADYIPPPKSEPPPFTSGTVAFGLSPVDSDNPLSSHDAPFYRTPAPPPKSSIPSDFAFSFAMPPSDTSPKITNEEALRSFAASASTSTIRSPTKTTARDPYAFSQQYQTVSEASSSSAGPSKRPALFPTTPNEELPGFNLRPSLVPFDPSAPPARALSPPVVTYRAPEELDFAETRIAPERELFAEPVGDLREYDVRIDTDGNDADEEWWTEEEGFGQAPGAFPEERRLAVRGPRLMPLPDPEDEEEFIDVPVEVGADQALQAAQEDEFEGPEDEVEGAMEAIGLRGPFVVLFQNAILVMFLLYFAMGFGLWVPYVIGKSVALTTLRPRRALYVVNFPIRTVRFFTDPFIDFILWALRSFVIPLFRPVLKITGQPSIFDMKLTRTTSSKTDWSKVLEGAGPWLQVQLASAETALSPARERLVSVIATQTASLKESSPALASFYDGGAEYAQQVFQHPFVTSFVPRLKEGYGPFLDYAKTTLQVAWKQWELLARGDGADERTMAVLLGYTVTLASAAFVLESSGPNANTLARAVRSAIKQQVVVIKVAVFIVIELIAFPLGCGILLDFNTLPLFATGSLQSRIAFLHYSPLTAVFLHWMLGTMFMYQFAVLLSSCRSIMRSGAMWFIKDPADPNFHPIRDILDRPVWAQLRKLFTSAVMYSAVLTIGIGSVLHALRQRKYGFKNAPLFPLQTSMLDPLSDIPIDLLFLHIVIPYTLVSLRPKKVLRYVLEKFWKASARRLRLTSYMFGQRHPDQEMFDPRPLPTQVVDFVLRRPTPEKVRKGSFVRAPGTDTLLLAPDQMIFLPVDEAGQPLDDKGRETMRTQDEAAVKAGLTIESGFAHVYLPPRFKLRIIFFLFSLWTFGASIMLTCIGTPIFIGRYCISLVGHTPVHDAYTWTIGLYVLVGMAVLYRELKRLRRKGLSTPQRFAKAWIGTAAQVAYLFLMIGIVIPALTALVVDFYVILPLRMWFGSLGKPEIHLVEEWATGLIYMKMGMRALQHNPQNPMYIAWLHILRNGWRHPNAFAATTDFIIPAVLPSIVMLAAPALAVRYLQVYIPALAVEQAAIRYAYPMLFACSAIAVLSQSMHQHFQRWSQTIRDAEFLLELRLTNLEDKPASPTTPTAVT